MVCKYNLYTFLYASIINFFKEIIIILLIVLLFHSFAYSDNNLRQVKIEIPSTFNPVGSGARALGMGGAFISIADDASAASWNPGCLIYLIYPEISIVTSYYSREEENLFGTNTEASGINGISGNNLNYLSVSYPFRLINRNMIVSLACQHLYDFNRDWKFFLNKDAFNAIDEWHYKQTGNLSALGISYCIQVIPQLSAGITLNIWDKGFFGNKWKQVYHLKRKYYVTNELVYYSKQEDYEFSGINANFGILWRQGKICMGCVLKTNFTADITHEIQENTSQKTISHGHMHMPLSYGIGITYKFSDKLIVSADMYKTDWNTFKYVNKEGERSPITGFPLNQTSISPTYQLRTGFEYRFFNIFSDFILPIRGGLFYDPAPAEGLSDSFFGLSFGLGITKNNLFSIDIAYQYRFANDVAKYSLKQFNFSQDIQEHKLYTSFILYSF